MIVRNVPRHLTAHRATPHDENVLGHVELLDGGKPLGSDLFFGVSVWLRGGQVGCTRRDHQLQCGSADAVRQVATRPHLEASRAAGEVCILLDCGAYVVVWDFSAVRELHRAISRAVQNSRDFPTDESPLRERFYEEVRGFHKHRVTREGTLWSRLVYGMRVASWYDEEILQRAAAILCRCLSFLSICGQERRLGQQPTAYRCV